MHWIRGKWLVLGSSICMVLILGSDCSLAGKHSGGGVGALDNGPRPGAKIRTHPLGKCMKASVALGKKPGEIDLTVWCKGGKPEEDVGFMIGRAIRPYAGIHTGITQVAGSPRLTGPGASHRFGVCEPFRGLVACDGLAQGRARFSGRIFVESERCKWKFVVTSTLPSGGEGEGWSGPRLIRTLWKDKTRGC